MGCQWQYDGRRYTPGRVASGGRHCVKDHYNLGLGVPSRDIVDNELKVKERRRQIAFERQRRDAERS